MTVRWPLVGDGRDHLGNDVAGALDDDRVSDTDVLARDLVLVVQGRTGDDDPADGHGRQIGHRGQGACPADLDGNLFEDRLRLFGGELVGDRPPRGPADETEALLPVEAVDLIDDAIDVVGQGGALVLQFLVDGEDVVHVHAQAGPGD